MSCSGDVATRPKRTSTSAQPTQPNKHPPDTYNTRLPRESTTQQLKTTETHTHTFCCGFYKIVTETQQKRLSPHLPSSSSRSASGAPGLCVMLPPMRRASGAVRLKLIVVGSSASNTTSSSAVSQLNSTAAPPSPLWFQLRRKMPTVLALPWENTACVGVCVCVGLAIWRVGGVCTWTCKQVKTI